MKIYKNSSDDGNLIGIAEKLVFVDGDQTAYTRDGEEGKVQVQRGETQTTIHDVHDMN